MASNNPQNLENICDLDRSDNVTSAGSEDSEPSANVEYKEIKKPLSYLIFDTETTGLPGLYGNPRITELCLLGVHREDMVEDGVRIPRVVNKLQLCLNPQKRVTPGSSMITGLFNDALERQQPLNQDTIAIIRGFIQTQAQPACLIAHNGDKFDFPLLASELKAIQEELPQGLLCADSLLALRELDADSGHNSPIDMRLGQQTWDRTETTPVKRVIPDGEQEEAVLPKKPKKDFKSESLFENIERDKVAKKLQYTDQNENVKCNQNTELTVRKSNSGQQTNSSSDSKPLSASSFGDDSPDCVRNCLGAANEKMRKEICEFDRNGMIRSDLRKFKTPPTQIQASNGGKRRSFRLADIYKRLFGNPPQAAHTAEDDCISLLKIVKKFSPRFLDWVDENCVPFTTVKPMY